MKMLKYFKTDQPGRVIAVFVISPLLAYKGYIYKDIFISSFAVTLFIWDIYWMKKPPRYCN